MPKPIIKDIQVKKRVTQTIQTPATRPITEREPVKQPEKRPVFSSSPIKKIESEPARITKESLELIRSVSPEPVLERYRTPKRRQQSSRAKKFLLVMLLIITVILTILYLITRTKITITPKIEDKKVSESITINSWRLPFKSSVMSIEEESPIIIDEENTKKILDEKIINRFKYDTPSGYLILSNCKTNTYYENEKVIDGKPGQIKANISALIIEKSGLLDYLKKSMKLTNEEIKNIDKLSCDLKSDITGYGAGQKAEALSFLINGEIKTEKVISSPDIINSIIGRSKKTAINTLNTNEDILNYSFKLRPFNFFPIIPKNTAHVKIKIESILN